MATTLDLALLYLIAAVIGVVAFRSLKLPPMLGYLTVGVLIGPNALALARDSAGIQYLAEFGVVFLMFVIGLEFSLPRLRAMRHLVFGLGSLQVVLTMAAALLLNALLAWGFALLGRRWGIGWQSAVALGGALAMSSTAIVVKMMSERLETESEHGRRVLGVLLFQDLAVVPLLVLIPALGDSADGQSTTAMLKTLGLVALKAGFLLTLLLTIGPRLMPRWLNLVARRKSEELFMLNLLLTTLGLAWLTEHFGLSLALGAFLAGMLIAETDYKHQVEVDIRPFQDVLLGLFFITIGMKLDWREVVDNWAAVLLLVTLPVFFKAALVTALSKLLGAPTGVSLRTGLYLAQAGEFGFVLLNLAEDAHLLSQRQLSPVLASMILSMLATPLIIMYSNRIVMKLSSSDWLLQSVAMTSIARRSINAERHVIICGFGRCGQNLARLLEQEHISYIALDLDPDRVAQATAAGQSVVFGDAARLQALVSAGLSRAAAVVISYHDTPSALKILQLVRQQAPTLPVIVRTVDDTDLDRLQAAGATEVVPEVIEGSLMLASHALALLGVPVKRVVRIVRDQREARYGLLRGYFHGATDDDTAEDLQQVRLHTLTLPDRASCLGKPVDTLPWGTWKVSLVSVRRANGAVVTPAGELTLGPADTLVLSGLPEDLARAEKSLSMSS
jgi:CPA2 family monovalent cation:H+ antiporter-2